MKNLLLGIGTLLVISGIVSVNLWLDLRTERLASTQLRARLAEAGATADAPAPVAQPVAAPTPRSASPDAPDAAASSAAIPADNETEMRATAAAISAGAVAAARGSGDAELMKDPEFRLARLTQQRVRLARSNPGLAETLGLSEKEASHLFEVMAERQVNLSAEFVALSSRAGGVGPAFNEILQTRASAEDPARAVLGEAKYAQFQEYQRNVRPALTQVASIGSSLDAAGQPLNDSQTRTLTAMMMTEQQRQRQEAAMPRPTLNAGTPRGLADSLEETANRQHASNRRILEASAATLNAAQLEVLKQQFDQQDATRRRSIETARELDVRRQTSTQPSTPPARAP